MDCYKAEIEKNVRPHLKISVIIISYNVRSFLRQCIKSVLNSEGINDIEIIVFDNNSFDQSADMVTSEFPAVKLIKNSKNLGFAAAVNAAVSNSVGDKICLLNPDCVLKTDTLIKLAEYLNNNSETGIVGAKVINADGTIQRASRRSFPTFFMGFSRLFGLDRLFPNSKLFGAYNQTHQSEKDIQKSDAVSGSCMMFSRSHFDVLNGFDEKFFLYFEDTDFCERMKIQGLNVIYNPNAVVIHYKGESLKHAPFDSIKIFHESMLYFFRKYKSRFKLWPISFLLLKLGILCHRSMAYLKKNKYSIGTCAADLILIISSFTGSIYLWYPFYHDTPFNQSLLLKHSPLILFFILTWLILAWNFKLYTKRFISYGRAVAAIFMTFIFSSVFVYFISVIAYSRVVLLFSSFACGILLPAWRIFIMVLHKNTHLKIIHESPLFTRTIAILGTDSDSLNTGKLLVNTPASDFKMAGYIEHQKNEVHAVENRDIIGRLGNIPDLIEKYKINELIIPEKHYTAEFLIRLFKQLRDFPTTIKYVSGKDNLLIGKGIMENMGGMTLYKLDVPLFDRFHLLLKRSFDFILSGILVVILSPILILTALTSGINKRSYWGEKNSKFDLYSFNVKSSWIKDLPYLFGVLSGHLSFVGCRKIPASEVKPNLVFKPGLTGLGHLKPKNESRNLEIFDEYYFQNYSLLFDLEILLKSLLKI